MSQKSSVSGRQYLLARKNPKTKFNETLIYEGSLRQKPQGWKLVRPL